MIASRMAEGLVARGQYSGVVARHDGGEKKRTSNRLNDDPGEQWAAGARFDNCVRRY